MSGLSLAERLALVQFLTQMLASARADDLGPRAGAEMAAGERYAAKFGGTAPAAWVSMPKPSARASVTSQAAFLAWCEERFPSEVETVRQVRPSFAAKMRQLVKERGGWINKDTGELIPVPGIEASEGEPAVRVELTEDAARIIGAAWAAGDIALGEVLALPAPGGREDGAA